jgi:transposase
VELAVMEARSRLRVANRQQLRLEPFDLESLIEAEHPVRSTWRVLDGIDLSRFEESIKAREGAAGQNRTHSKILLGAVWPQRGRGL